MLKKPSHNALRIRRHIRVRKKVFGTSLRPRLNIFRSLKHIYAQIIDDERSITLVAVSSLESDLKSMISTVKDKKEIAAAVGSLIAKKALERNIEQVVFDRAGYLYHGRVKALAEAARSGGIKF